MAAGSCKIDIFDLQYITLWYMICFIGERPAERLHIYIIIIILYEITISGLSSVCGHRHLCSTHMRAHSFNLSHSLIYYKYTHSQIHANIIAISIKILILSCPVHVPKLYTLWVQSSSVARVLQGHE